MISMDAIRAEIVHRRLHVRSAYESQFTDAQHKAAADLCDYAGIQRVPLATRDLRGTP